MEIGKLFVSIGADLKGFQQGLANVKTQMAGVKGTIVKHNKAIGGSMMALGGGILAMGTLSVKSYADMGDEIAKMAKRTGFSTEALSELRHAAELSGTSLTGIEKATRTLSGAIVDAGDGLATYTRAFADIGLSYEDLAALSPEEQFNRVLIALAGVEDETVRAARASDLFGARMGTALLPMVSDGVEVFEGMKQEAHELGIVFDEEAAAKAEEMKDSMLRLEKAVTSISIVIAEQLMPAILPLITLITTVTKKIRGWLDQHPLLAKVIIGVTAALGLLLVPIGAMIFFLPQLIALHNLHIVSLIAHKIATIAGTVATWAATVATTAFGVATALATLPVLAIILAIGALIVIGVLLWKNWDKITNFFKTTVVDAFKKIWDFLKEWGLLILGIIFPPALVVGAIMKWKDKIVGALKTVWDTIVRIAKAPLNAIIGLFNKMTGFFSGKKLFSIKIPGWVPGIGGKRFELKLPAIPKIPSLQYGGKVPGPRGAPTLIVAHGEEEFLGPGGRPGIGEPSIGELHIHTLVFSGTRADAKKLWDFLREAARGDQRKMLGEAEW